MRFNRLFLTQNKLSGEVVVQTGNDGMAAILHQCIFGKVFSGRLILYLSSIPETLIRFWFDWPSVRARKNLVVWLTRVKCLSTMTVVSTGSVLAGNGELLSLILFR